MDQYNSTAAGSEDPLPAFFSHLQASDKENVLGSLKKSVKIHRTRHACSKAELHAAQRPAVRALNHP